ncbi:DUF6892 domain-containing protein [Sinomicrobium weinanense]|uniref:Uncharacterized protein n=1 Tax=Sinomicrobium weinanense TaxID=2842200 RepID=A0A926JTY8_9FLAO|nr:hypothetical protein [Sinomicrobium weinanense]MBC9797136.1 hypothetical protein [Sinomicrobium weinanense]MBU3124837.1 hypothetical protein [Sinomicrobium weinanense]
MINLFNKKAEPADIDYKEGAFYINGVAVSFPTSATVLYKALGKPSRSGKTRTTKTTIDCWDKLGIYADYANASHILYILLITNKHNGIQMQPKRFYNGEITVEGKPFAQQGKRSLSLGPHEIGQLVKDGKTLGYYIGWNVYYKEEVPADKYTIHPLEEEVIDFNDFGFKVSIIQELMYNKKLLQPAFDLYEFAEWYDKRKIDIEEEGYEPISEVTQYFKDLPIPKRLAREVTEIYQDGGNEIYLHLLRFGEGREDYWDIESTEDAKHFPNLKKAVLCYAKEHVIEELNEKGIKARWL